MRARLLLAVDGDWGVGQCLSAGAVLGSRAGARGRGVELSAVGERICRPEAAAAARVGVRELCVVHESLHGDAISSGSFGHF